MSYLPQWLTDTASISSLIGLIITIFVLYEAKKISQFYLMRVRLPEIINDLENISTKLPEITKNWEESKHERTKELARCNSILKNLKPKLEKYHQKSIKDVIKILESKNIFGLSFGNKYMSELSQEQIFNIFEKLQIVVEDLKQKNKNLKWER